MTSSPTTSGTVRQVFSPQCVIDSRLWGSRSGSEIVSSTASALASSAR